MFGLSEIERLKREARSAYRTRMAIFDEMDCGHAVAMVISSRYRNAFERYNRAMERLREIDPTFPRENYHAEA